MLDLHSFQHVFQSLMQILILPLACRVVSNHETVGGGWIRLLQREIFSTGIRTSLLDCLRSFCADGSFVTVPLFQENVLRQLFEANVFKLLGSEGYITAELIAKMRKHSGFHVYAGPTITHKKDSVRVGLYIVRPPKSASRLALAAKRGSHRSGNRALAKYFSSPSVDPAGRFYHLKCFVFLPVNVFLLSFLPESRSSSHNFHSAE